MRFVTATMNNGRWLINCARCHIPLPAREEGVICPICWPSIGAKAFKQLPNGLFRPVSDMELVLKAQSDARNAEEEYFPLFPDERAEIERILRLRPRPANMNWVPGETLEFLRAENIEHGDAVPE